MKFYRSSHLAQFVCSEAWAHSAEFSFNVHEQVFFVFAPPEYLTAAVI